MSKIGERQQSQTGDTTGNARHQQSQDDWRALADAAANIPNALYASRAGEDVKKSACCRPHKLLQIKTITGLVFALVITILLPYLAAKVAILSDEVSEVRARNRINEQRLTKLEGQMQLQQSGGGFQQSGGGVQQSGGGVQQSGGGVQQSGGGVQQSGGGARWSFPTVIWKCPVEASCSQVEVPGGGAQQSGGGVKQSDGGVKQSDGGVKQSDGGVKQSGGGVQQSGGGVKQSGGGFKQPNESVKQPSDPDSVNAHLPMLIRGQARGQEFSRLIARAQEQARELSQMVPSKYHHGRLYHPYMKTANRSPNRSNGVHPRGAR
uniref:Uncharacterized protein n=1 Tax=Branchiostoma floridae TaxID=7739 RepID=C3YJH4_BRAFL|eukprot:XP_002603562.1 hypothetical protein BRAFLDRAFT_79095 [Branchiostoma floridae]